jgi:hypothetical protein
MLVRRAEAHPFTAVVVRPAAKLAGIAQLQTAEPMRVLRFTSAMLCMTLLFQRFGLLMGSSAVSLVGPIGIAAAAFALATGTLALNRFRLTTYLLLALCVAVGLVWHSLTPSGDIGGEPNLQSLSQFLLLTSFAVFTFAEPIDEQYFFRKVNSWFAFIAAAGVLQFFLQFLGLGIFAFAGILPKFMLIEFAYNLQIPLGVGSLMKSNGFFLIEPSAFSQVMALGLIIEILAFKRLTYLLLFFAGLVLSFSGTGWIVLSSFIVAAALGMGWRGIVMAGATVILLAVLLGVGSYLLPDVASALAQRSTELSRPGTSGHLRFITPFWALHDMLTERPSAALLGLGAGISERLNLTYEYDVNTPIKIVLDYGFPALLSYVLLFIGGRKSPIQAGILVPACILFFLTGGYQQYPPMLFLILLLTSVARLRASSDVPPAQQSYPGRV